MSILKNNELTKNDKIVFDCALNLNSNLKNSNEKDINVCCNRSCRDGNCR